METKQSFQQKIDAQKADVQASIDELKAKSHRLEAEGRRDLADALEAIERKRVEAETKLQDIKNDSANAWEGAKSSVEGAYADLRKSISNAADKFS